MTRRNFIKSLVAVGAISALTASGLDIPDIKYPEITYSKEFIIEKLAYLHYVTMPTKDGLYYVSEYSDEEYLPEWLLDDMIEKLKASA